MLLELILGFYLGVFISLLILAIFVYFLKLYGYSDEAKELEMTLWIVINIFVATLMFVLFISLFS